MIDTYRDIRSHSEAICRPLKTEDYVPQPIELVSPPKWQLAHMSWFFEYFILIPNCKTHKEYNPLYSYFFNSYYNYAGDRVVRHSRGDMSRPTVEEVYTYRKYVDDSMIKYMAGEIPQGIKDLIRLGLNHEQQHQELLLTDIKYILGHNPLYPIYSETFSEGEELGDELNFLSVNEGLHTIGYQGKDFCFDNELKAHKVYIEGFEIADRLVTNGEYIDFIRDGAYKRHDIWHSEAWQWINEKGIDKPLYWLDRDGDFYRYTMSGLQKVRVNEALCHVSFFEACAFSQWKGLRLPTEFEWEASQHLFDWGSRWEWTESAYTPYPGYKKSEGAVGEYNGKFMVNQKVLRGGSVATPAGHSRSSYRNFFHPHERWQYTGIRLAK
jgi:ergothioneine biosynthesis protein EgtB